MQVWHLEANFCRVAGKLYEILRDSHLERDFTELAEILKVAQNEELFSFALKLLLEEWKVRHWQWRQKVNEIEEQLQLPRFEELLSLEEWFKMSLAGLNCKPYPTVEYLLKKQGRPAIYQDLIDTFSCTILLNRLVEAFDVNTETSDIMLSPLERSLLAKMPPEIPKLTNGCFGVDSAISDPEFATLPAFKDLVQYCAVESRTEFSNLPTQLLEPNEDSDLGAPFAKRWARRIAARPSALDKIYFHSSSHGSFPSQISGSGEVNFDVQLPAETEAELLHNNFFELSMLTAEFIDNSCFLVRLAQCLTQIPKTLLRHRLRNTEIFAHASTKNPVNFRAILLATGLRGHLDSASLPLVDIHEILNFNSAETSACLFLGLGASAAVNETVFERDFLLKLFSLHLPSAVMEDLEIPPLLQMSAALALGLFRFGSADRGPSHLLLKEVFRPLALNVNCKASDTPMLSYAAALALGFILMGHLKTQNGLSLQSAQFAQDIMLELKCKASQNPQYQISALMACSLIAFDSGATDEVESFIPWCRNIGDLLDRPDGVVFWNIFAWRMAHWSQQLPIGLHDQGKDRFLLDFEAIFDVVCQPASDSMWTFSGELGLFAYACQVLTANALFLSLRFAGAASECPKSLLNNLQLWMEKILSFPILFNTDPDFFLTRIQTYLLTAYQYMLLANCLMHAGSGNEDCWRRLRQLFAHPLLFKYGNAHLLYSSIGFLFAKSPISTKTNFSVAGLLSSLLPILPTQPGEPEFAVNFLMQSFWVFAAEIK